MLRAGKGRGRPLRPVLPVLRVILKSRRRAPAALALLGILSACLALLAALPGCGGAQAGTNPAAGRSPSLEVRGVDLERSRLAQAGQLDARTLPPERSWYNQLRRDEAGNIQRDHSGKPLVIPWIVDSAPMLELEDLSSVSNPGTDNSGRPCVVLGLNPGGQQKLEQAIAGGAFTPGGAQVAIMAGSEVVAVVPLPADSASGIVFNVSAPQALRFESTYSWVGS